MSLCSSKEASPGQMPTCFISGFLSPACAACSTSTPAGEKTLYRSFLLACNRAGLWVLGSLKQSPGAGPKLGSNSQCPVTRCRLVGSSCTSWHPGGVNEVQPEEDAAPRGEEGDPGRCLLRREGRHRLL